MKHELNIWVVGGDMRQAKLAQLLAQDGHTVHTYALEQDRSAGPLPETDLSQAEKADCVVLPLLVSAEGGLLNAPLSRTEHPLSDVLDALRPSQFICGGRLDSEVLALAAHRGLTIRDYFAREELAVANAVPTAEGALQLAPHRPALPGPGGKGLRGGPPVCAVGLGPGHGAWHRASGPSGRMAVRL